MRYDQILCDVHGLVSVPVWALNKGKFICHDCHMAAKHHIQAEHDIVMRLNGTLVDDPDKRKPVTHNKPINRAALVGINERYFIKHPHMKGHVGSFYHIRITSDTEVFDKFGISTHIDITDRIASIQRTYPNVEILQHTNMSLYDAYKIEQDMLSQLYEQRYVPTHHFGGWTECVHPQE